MQGSLFAVVAIALILVLLLVWLNVVMVRRGKSKRKAAENDEVQEVTGNQRVPESADSASSTQAAHSERRKPSEERTGRMNQEPSAQTETSQQGTPFVDATGVHQDPRADRNISRQSEMQRSVQTTPQDVEVVQRDGRARQGQGNKVFERNPLPYFLHGASVPEFESGEWHEVFMRLSGDPNVMGWVAFHDDRAGASDREYEYSFLEVLRSYKRSVTSLQREVGLSQVLETSVVGEEGKIWFLTGSQEHWFALFVDRNADVHEIMQPFMNYLSDK